MAYFEGKNFIRIRRFLPNILAMGITAWLVFSPSLNATAQAVSQDFQLWSPVYLTVSHGKKIQGWYEVQPRFGGNVSQVNQLLLRTALGYKLTQDWSVWQGYAWTPAFVPVFTNENRIYQQLLYIRKFPRVGIVSRNRLEQRWIENVPGTAVRLRMLLRGQIPFDEAQVWSIVVQDEFFVNFNSPPNGPAAGFDQNRLFVGFNRKVNEHLLVDTGYQIQTINTREPGFIDNINHILLMQFFVFW